MSENQCSNWATICFANSLWQWDGADAIGLCGGEVCGASDSADREQDGLWMWSFIDRRISGG